MALNRFGFGKPYILNDSKGMAFVDEPAIYVGKKDSDMERPTICAVCGEPLGSIGYHSFFLMGPKGHGIDMMIGNGCIKDRISARELDVETSSFKDTWNILVTDFPDSGRWYGTFLHHCIAKPYVRNRSCSDKWDESVLGLPGVRFIMRIIDDLRDEGWHLDAEVSLDCGNVDLLAIHPDRGTVVFDWKSDLCYDGYEAYVDQINRYMAELHAGGSRNISGYILWVRDERREYVSFKSASETIMETKPDVRIPSPSIQCLLKIDMGGGSGIEFRTMRRSSSHRVYGDEVFFSIPSCRPEKVGYEFCGFEASPYREGGLPQWFGIERAEEGIPLTFICTRGRHSFCLKANWRRVRPFVCTLHVCGPYSAMNPINGKIETMSEVDEDGNDIVEFDVSEIKRCLNGNSPTYAMLEDGEFEGMKNEWGSEELQDGMKITILCPDGCSDFRIFVIVETKQKGRGDCDNIVESNASSVHSRSKERLSEKFHGNLPIDGNIGIPGIENPTGFILNGSSPYQREASHSLDIAERSFTPGRIYKSGSRYYGIYRRRESDRHNAVSKVDVAEVDHGGRRLSKLEWRHVYITSAGKEYIYGISDRKWKVYTKGVLVDLIPEGWTDSG